jgi:hypothetical protein
LEEVKDIDWQKAAFICAALKDSSAKKGIDLLNGYEIVRNIMQRKMAKALVERYFYIKKVTDSICLITLMWGFLYSLGAVKTRYE